MDLGRGREGSNFPLSVFGFRFLVFVAEEGVKKPFCARDSRSRRRRADAESNLRKAIIIISSFKDFAPKAISTLKNDGVIAYPTEAMFGLGCNIYSDKTPTSSCYLT